MPSTANRPIPKDRLAIALDFADEHEAIKLVDSLGQTCSWYKVGMELYYAAGNGIIQQLRDRGFNVFLDLKLHDIPNTVAGAVRSATQAGASLLTIHASGGAAMMTAAAQAASAPNSPRLPAVTVLTAEGDVERAVEEEQRAALVLDARVEAGVAVRDRGHRERHRPAAGGLFLPGVHRERVDDMRAVPRHDKHAA